MTTIDHGTHSEETIHHYQCRTCEKWWSIGAPPTPPKQQFCPWCGVMQDFAESSVDEKIDTA